MAGSDTADVGVQGASGWAPYWLPMLAFLLAVEVGRRVPEEAAPLFLVLRVAAPLGLLVYFAQRGAYPELRPAPGPSLWAADVAIGLAGAALWIAPFLVWDSLRPAQTGFDAAQLGERGVVLALTLRAVGYVAVTPFVEELFVRSWMLRYVDVVEQRRDFRSVPIGRFRWRSFCVVIIYFVFSHARWEWGVMLGWSLLTMAWLYHRKQMMPLVRVHAVTNGAIFLFVLAADGRFQDASGASLSLWFLL